MALKKSPKLLSARSWAFRCLQCGRWLGRFPMFLYQIDQDQCPRCGCTSFRQSEGRPYGPKSKDWEWIQRNFDNNWELIEPEEFHMVVTDPPLVQLQ